MRLRASVLALFGLACALITQHVSASTPAAMTLVTPVGEQREIAWNEVTGADHYVLTGTLVATRISRTQCVPPLVEEQITVSVDEILPTNVTSFSVALPPLPSQDTWIIFDSRTQVQAFDADEQLLAQGNVSSVVAPTTFVCPTATPPPVLPDTGSGPDGAEGHWPAAAGITGVIAALALVSVALVAGRRG